MTESDLWTSELTPERAHELLQIANDLPVDRLRSQREADKPKTLPQSASVFTPGERSYLEGQTIGRIGTASPTGRPDVAPVRYELLDDTIVVSGMDPERTIKLHNVASAGAASFVVDDMISERPWLPRGLKLTGVARVTKSGSQSLIEISPDTVWSWAINDDAPTYFGPIEKRRSSEAGTT